MASSGSIVRTPRQRLGALVVVVGAIAASATWGGLLLYALYVVGILVGTGVLVSSYSLRHVQVVRTLSADRVELGGTVEVNLSVHNRGRWPCPWLWVEDEVEAGLDTEGPRLALTWLRGNGVLHLDYRLHTLRRGLFRIGPTTIEASGPLALVRRTWRQDAADFLTVLPVEAQHPREPPFRRPAYDRPLKHSLFRDATRIVGIREYRRGDALRSVHWRATARTGRLQVKIAEPVGAGGALIAVDMGRDAYRVGGDAAGLGARVDEQAVEEIVVAAAAALADRVLDGGEAVGLLSNGSDAADRYPEHWRGSTFRRGDDAGLAGAARRALQSRAPLELPPGRAHWQRQRLRLALARVCLRDHLTLAELLVAELPRLPRELVLIVVSPHVDAPLAAVRRAGIEVETVTLGASATPDLPHHRLQGERALQELVAR